jgi:hypothetical protein
MNDEELIFVDRVTVAIGPKTKKSFSKTKDGQQGIIFPERTADTYDANSRKKTHRTKMVERGIIFPERVAETRSADSPRPSRPQHHGNLHAHRTPGPTASRPYRSQQTIGLHHTAGL